MRINESKVRVILALLTPPMLIGMALLTLAVESPVAVPITFGVLGALLGIVVLFDFPLAIDVSTESLDRLCLIRRQSLPWETVGTIIKPKRRGLVLVTTKRKRHVLIDRILEPAERRHIIDIGESHGVQVEI